MTPVQGMVPLCECALALACGYGYLQVSAVPLAVFMSHEVYMQRALELARRYRGFTSPNPCVGAVLVKDDSVIADGAHRRAGESHAEAVVLRKAGQQVRGATLYCTLEPCNHEGRTPPCTEAIIQAGVSRVVFASKDPNPDVEGNGANRLRAAGIEVLQGILEKEADHLIREFLHACRLGRPWVTAKMATSLDGKVATSTGDSKWITTPDAREHGHRMRHEHDAILVGAGTVLADDPSLTVRLPNGPWKQPTRVVMDSTGRSPVSAAVFAPGKSAPILATTDAISDEKLFEERGVDVEVLSADAAGRVDPLALLEALAARAVQSVLIEGGPTIIGSFLERDLIDEVLQYISPSLIGGNDAKGAIAGEGRTRLAERLWLKDVTTERCGMDILIRGLVQRTSPNTD